MREEEKREGMGMEEQGNWGGEDVGDRKGKSTMPVGDLCIASRSAVHVL